MAEGYSGPLPVPTPETRPFWEAARRRELLIQRCGRCGQRFFYPRPFSPCCLSERVEWVRASGRARLHTFVVQHRPPRGFPVAPPYAIAIVELEEGPRMMARLVRVEPDPERLPLDLPLVVDFEELTPEVTLPVFRPAGEP